MKRSVIFIALLFSLVCSLSAKVWFVCAGSFTKYENAEERCQILSEEGYDCFIETARKDDGSKVYRVLFLDNLLLRDEIRERKEQLKNADVIVKNGWTDLWICEADLPSEDSENVFKAAKAPVEEPFVLLPVPEPEIKTEIKIEPEVVAPEITEPEIRVEPKVVAPPEEPVVLETNEEVPISEENPYSVFVRSYREEEKAVNDRNRLKEQDINAYVLKKFDNKAFFKFDLHAGAFETEEEAEDYQEVLEEKGIKGTEVSNYEDFEEDLAKYDEVVVSEEVTLNTGAYEMPEVISENVQKCLSQFPINRDFQIVEASIIDCQKVRENFQTTSNYIFKDVKFLNMIPSHLDAKKELDSVSYVKYEDSLFNKTVYVIILESENEKPELETLYSYKEKESVKKDFQIQYGVLHSFVMSEYGDKYFLYGYTDDKKLGLILTAENFSEKEFEAFMNCSFGDSSLLIYPQLRRSLYVLPKEEKEGRDFLLFNLVQVPESYAAERNYVDWSLQMVGHWLSHGFFIQNGYVMNAAFFDLDYDYNARLNQELFMKEKKEKGISSTNKPVDVHGTEGWITNSEELDFANRSYSMAINSYVFDDVPMDEKLELAEDLNIW